MEANIAYYCLHKLHKWPQSSWTLRSRNRAYVVAAVQMKLEKDKREAQKMKKGKKR